MLVKPIKKSFFFLFIHSAELSDVDLRCCIRRSLVWSLSVTSLALKAVTHQQLLDIYQEGYAEILILSAVMCLKGKIREIPQPEATESASNVKCLCLASCLGPLRLALM